MSKDKKMQKGFLGRSRKFIKVGSFVLVFCLIGIGALLFTRAATYPSVRFVLFCSTNQCSGSVDTINKRAMAVRSWYKSQLGNGRTFRLLTTKKVIGHHSSSFYGGGSLSAYNTVNDIHSYESWLQEPNVKTVLILGFPSMDHCGASDTPGWLAVVDPFRTCSSFISSVYAHELGHTFGLGHTYDGTLMSSPAACGSRTLGYCNINSSQKSYLLNYRYNWFPSVNNATGAVYDPDLVPYLEYPYLVEITDDGTSQLPPPPPPPAPPPPTNIGTTLQTNQRMYPNQMLVDNGYSLLYQLDGNLALYNSSGGVFWATGTIGRSLGNLSMQGDGNLILYNDYGGAMWSTGTSGKGSNNFFVIGQDGNMVVETNHGIPVWGLYQGGNIPEYPPNHWFSQPSNILYAHQILQPNQSLSINGYRLTYQGDGNLVEYDTIGQAIWSTRTNGRSLGNLKMQDDGNLVLYNDYGGAMWSTGTSGTGGANYLSILWNGNVVIYNNAGAVVWHLW